MTELIHMLVGGMLVVIGVFAGGFAGRVRDTRLAPTSPPKSRRERMRASHAQEGPSTCDGADDVIAALVSAGYRRAAAVDATRACSQTDRMTIADWTRAALSRCAKGASS